MVLFQFGIAWIWIFVSHSRSIYSSSRKYCKNKWDQVKTKFRRKSTVKDLDRLWPRLQTCSTVPIGVTPPCSAPTQMKKNVGLGTRTHLKVHKFSHTRVINLDSRVLYVMDICDCMGLRKQGMWAHDFCLLFQSFWDHNSLSHATWYRHWSRKIYKRGWLTQGSILYTSYIEVWNTVLVVNVVALPMVQTFLGMKV